MSRDNHSKIRHDLRNAVNGIIGLLDVLANTKLDSNQQKFVRMAAASARTVIDITESAFPEDISPLEYHTDATDSEEGLTGTLKVLAADDDSVNRLLLEHHLKELSSELTLVGDGQEALSAFSENSYDLVILDYIMPEMNGLEAAEGIRKSSTVPILIVTGGMNSEVSARCQELGKISLLYKPFNKSDLHNCILELFPDAALIKAESPTNYYHFSPEALSELSMGDPGVTEELLVDLLAELEKSENSAREAIVKEDRQALLTVIQSMASLAETIHAALLFNTLKKLELSVLEESWDLLNIVTGALWIHCQSLKIEIERYIQSLK